MAQALVKTFTGITATGVPAQASTGAPPFGSPGGAPFNSYAIQVQGTDGTLTSWSVTLDGSLDGVKWTTLITHAATEGSTQWAVDKPVLFVRVNVASLTLNTATSATVRIVALPRS